MSSLRHAPGVMARLLARPAVAALVAGAVLVPATAWAGFAYVHYSAYAGSVTTRAPFPTNKVAITFDDGPTNNAARILATLKTYGARGTFFVIGNRIRGRSQLRQILAEGSEIGNHTWSHVSLDGLTSAEDQKEIGLTDALIYHYTGRRPLWTRSMAGVIDPTGLEAVNRMGRLYVNWDADGQDTVAADPSPQGIASHVLMTVTAGSVILLHESTPATVEALPEILAGLRARGYTVTTVSDLLSEP